MNRILGALGKPHKTFKSIHIAGTKGKGSTASMLAAMLSASGQKVGLYTSPHILDIRERIVVDGDMIPESAFTKVVGKIIGCLAKARVTKPTYFEILTAAAIQHFADQEVDIAVIEVGLGGRLDSTNVIQPEVAGITNISYDHIEQLGSDLESIAREKAGIMKRGVPVVSAPQTEKVRVVLREVADEVGAPIRFSDEDVQFSYRFEFSRSVGRHARICLTTENSRFEHLHVPLQGEHQAANCGLALTILDTIKGQGLEIDDHKAMVGLSNVKMAGRMQIISERPRILVDGAHNASSINALMRAIGQNVPYDSMIVIFACHKDKDISGMLRHLQLGADKMIFTRTDSPRAADPHELAASYTERCGKMAQVAESLEEAMTIAQSAHSREDIICITGSFYLVGDAMRAYGTLL
ncbi:MAG: bifunctional folylpolyglutamate synthase/dihydrofolate synthase [Phycisphaerae bacterium]